MTRKQKIMTSVAVLSFAIFGMIMGVYALVQRQISIGGTVSFSASTVRATYRVSKTEAYAGETIGAMTEVASGTFNESNQNNASAELGNAMLSDNANKFAYEVVITSTESVRDLHITYTIPEPTQDWVSVLVNGEETPDPTAIIPAGQSLTITFEIIADAFNAPETAENIEIGTEFTISLSQEDAMADFQARMGRQALMRQANNQTPDFNQIQQRQQQNNVNNVEENQLQNINNTQNSEQQLNQNLPQRQVRN